MRLLLKLALTIASILLLQPWFASMTMSPAPLKHAQVILRRSEERGFANHGWLKTYHTFSFAGYLDRKFLGFGNLRVLNEDRVASFSGFPTHPHANFEIFSYILSGELTHRDSMIQKNLNIDENGPQFYKMRRNDVQFTTGGTGIAHSEINEGNKTVHFLQIWVKPWRYGLKPRYNNKRFDEDAKRKAFLPILSPVRDGIDHTDDDESTVAKIPDTIPIHQDFIMGAGIIEPGKTFTWNVGYGDVAESRTKRNVYVHLPMTNLHKKHQARIQINGQDNDLQEGDGAFVSLVNAGDLLSVASVGDAPAEVIILDSN